MTLRSLSPGLSGPCSRPTCNMCIPRVPEVRAASGRRNLSYFGVNLLRQKLYLLDFILITRMNDTDFWRRRFFSSS